MDNLKVISNGKKITSKHRNKRIFWIRIAAILGAFLMFSSVLASIFYYLKMS